MTTHLASGTHRPRREAADPRWSAANAAFLDASVERVRSLVHRRVLWLRRIWSHDPLTAHRGLVVSDQRADLLLRGSDPDKERDFRRTDPAARGVEARLAEVEASLEAARRDAVAAGAPPRLEELATRFGLPPFARDALLLAFAPELDPELEILYAYAQDDATRRYATPNLALALLDEGGQGPGSNRAALAQGAPLRRYGLLELSDGGAPSTSTGWRPLRVPERVQDFLRGAGPAEPPSALVHAVPAAPLSDALERMAGSLGESLAAGGSAGGHPSLSLLGPRGSGRRALAAALCRRLGLRMVALDVPTAAADPVGLSRERRLLEREARMCDLALYVDGDGVEDVADPAVRSQLVAILDRLDLPFLVGGVRRWPGARTVSLRSLPRLGAEERWGLWHAAFTEEGMSVNGGVERLVHQFELGPSGIAETVRTARRMAELDPGRGDADAVGLAWAACRERSGPSLDALAQRLDPAHGWDDIVLPGETLTQLRELGAQVRLRGKVYGAWGFGEKLGRRRGISALFSGPSGTGKTMAAEVLALDLDLPLYRIDLSGVVSKYIGETEKNLKKVFDAAEDSGVVLFFDEADALFGKRSEVKDSRDRYANMEVNYLLQRMEDYAGLVVLATNMRSHLDPAFLRRLRFLIDFPFPDSAHRRRIWEKSFPPRAETGALDLEALSRLGVPGGNIRNIAVNGAFLAADEGSAIEMRHLYHAARQEYAKIERLVVEAEFGSHARGRRR